MDSNLNSPNLLIHEFKSDNFDMICSWAKMRNFAVPRYEHLPPTGYVISWQGRAVAAAFIVKTDARMAIISNMISNPDIDKFVRQDAIEVLIRFCSDRAKKEGFIIAVISSHIPYMKNKFEKNGFVKTEDNVSIYGRIL